MAQETDTVLLDEDDTLAVDTAGDATLVASETMPLEVPESDLTKEQKLRHNLGRYLIVTIVSMCFYTFVLDHIEQLNKTFSSASYITTALTVLFFAGIIFLILTSGYRIAEFGLTLKNWRTSVKESVLFTVPILAGILLVKWLAIKFIAAFHGVPLFDLHGGVVHEKLEGTLQGHYIWLQTLCLYVLVIAPVQEIIARGGLQGALTLFLSSKRSVFIAIVLSNVMFSTTHLAYPIHIVVFSFLAGLYWGWLFHRHKTLIGPCIAHAMMGLWFFWFLGIA